MARQQLFVLRYLTCWGHNGNTWTQAQAVLRITPPAVVSTLWPPPSDRMRNVHLVTVLLHPIAALFCPASQLCYSECSSFSSSPRSCAWVCIVFYMSHGLSVGQKMAEKSAVPASWTGPPRACCIPWLPGEPKHNLLFASSSISQIILQDGPISFTFIKWQGYFYGSVDCEHPRHNYWWWGKCIMHEGILVFLWLQQCIHIPCI